MPKLHLVDATYELFRAYFAVPSERSPSGQEVGAIRGLVGSLLALLHQDDVTHIAAATDHIIESFRNRLFDGYKTGEGVPEDLMSQFPLAEEAMRALGIVVWPMIEFEADDALASAAVRYAGEVDQVIILSPDKDLCQCVRDGKVFTYDRRRQKLYDTQAVIEKFGIGPASIPDLLALVGDSADGYPGLPGWGMKTAAAVLREFGTIEAIPGDATQWRTGVRGAAKLAVTLAERREEAMLYKRLAILRTDVPLQEKLDDLKWRGVRRRDFEMLCERFGFGDLAGRPKRWSA
jgi:5'-3' exonuclease